MDFVFPAPPVAALPVVGGGSFPIRRVFCVGRNYAAHAREMGHSGREAPFFFTKPADAVTTEPSIPFPSATQDLHHEVELVVAIGPGGEPWGYAVGLDLTRRDLQAEAKDKGRPWDMAKGFDRSAPCAPLTPAARAGDVSNAAIRLTINGETRQDGTTAELIWTVPEVIAALSELIELKAGDLIFTGTPEGVGPIRPGDRLTAMIDGLPELTVSIG